MAHVDAGKTTITENFLYLSGATRKRGSVDTGSAITDHLEIERQRGISVRAACVSFEWQDSLINLLDTPGHVDFSAEVERVLRVLDGAIVVLSAVEGVQAHTLTIVETLVELNIPFLFFINKIDREGADFERVFQEIKKDLKVTPIPLFAPLQEGSNQASIFSFWEKELPDSFRHLHEQVSESIIELDDELMLQYLDANPISKSELWDSAERNIQQQKLRPIVTGAAKKQIGMQELLDAAVKYLPSAKREENRPSSALVYKVEHHKLYGRLAHIRVFEGSIHAKETVPFPIQKKEKKVGLTKRLSLNKLEDVDGIKAGEIGVITGVPDIYAGDILGNPTPIPSSKTLQQPVMTVQVIPDNIQDYNALSHALQILDSEDPSLSLKWYKDEYEFHLQIMGPIQTEILKDQLEKRFNVQASFLDPVVIYKERPLKKAEGYVRYWMPKPCWAIMTFLIEPGAIGSGVVYDSKVRQSDIHLKYQNEVKRTIPRALRQGIKGWEVTDIKITLISGEDHVMHSKPGDFVLATPMGIMRALEAADTELLEPVLAFTIKAPEEYLGKIAGDLTRMRARFANPAFEGGIFTLHGVVPAATSLDYSIKLSSVTSGRGHIHLKMHGYEPCPKGEGVIREYKGVNPLDESKWILHQRGAYKAEERER